MSRPVPEDFKQRCLVEGICTLSRRYRVGKATIYQWIADCGVRRPRLYGGLKAQKVPADFARYQVGRSNRQLADHYGCSPYMIYRWRRDTGCPLSIPAPADFAERFHTMSIKNLGLHYGRGWTIIQRWIAETGVVRQPKPKVVKQKPERVRPARKLTLVPSSKRNAFQLMPAPHAQRDMTLAGQAADYLRHFGPVFRCNERGRADVVGKMWRRGNAILTDQELIERADWMRRKEAA